MTAACPKLSCLSLLVIAAGLSAGCPSSPVCADGTTVNEQGECVVTPPSCGEGTSLVDGACVPVTCGEGTVFESGACVPIEAPCGGGSIEADGGCVFVPPACGAGTELLDGQCVPLGTIPVVECDPPCALGTYCAPSATCVPTPRPATWSCPFELYRDGENCNCGCGGFDADCADDTLPVVGCASDVCQLDGECEPCVPDCSGKQCGDNGCGGLCGTCVAPGLNKCESFTCVACEAQCADRQCGDDGCGGTCGNCGSGTSCQAGVCLAPPPSSSCAGNCGEVAADGCSCQAGCQAEGTCCADVDFQCGCLPDCDAKNCGGDGCGGTCGACLDEELCPLEQVCIDNPCDPNPCTEYGTCQEANGSCACAEGYAGATCGECASGYVGYPSCVVDQCAVLNETCFGHGTCVPATGLCDCDPGFTGPQCASCVAGVYPDCTL